MSSGISRKNTEAPAAKLKFPRVRAANPKRHPGHPALLLFFIPITPDKPFYPDFAAFEQFSRRDFISAKPSYRPRYSCPTRSSKKTDLPKTLTQPASPEQRYSRQSRRKSLSVRQNHRHYCFISTSFPIFLSAFAITVFIRL